MYKIIDTIGDIMKVVNFTEARNNLKSIFDTVYKDNEEVIVNRKNGENIVVISLDTYNSMKETSYLLSSAKNRERLLSSLAKSRAGKVSQKELLD